MSRIDPLLRGMAQGAAGPFQPGDGRVAPAPADTPPEEGRPRDPEASAHNGADRQWIVRLALLRRPSV